MIDDRVTVKLRVRDLVLELKLKLRLGLKFYLRLKLELVIVKNFDLRRQDRAGGRLIGEGKQVCGGVSLFKQVSTTTTHVRGRWMCERGGILVTALEVMLNNI